MCPCDVACMTVRFVEIHTQSCAQRSLRPLNPEPRTGGVATLHAVLFREHIRQDVQRAGLSPAAGCGAA